MAVKEGASALERGEYVVGLAILIAACLISFSVYYGAQGITSSVDKLKLTVNVPSGTAQPTQPAQPEVPSAPGAVKLAAPDLSSAPFQGKTSGKVTFIEFSDFQCPYCGRVTPTVEQVKSTYTDAKYYFMDFPLSFHQYAQKAAEAGACANKQGKFWELHNIMFSNQNNITVPELKSYAATLGMNTATFNACLDSGETAATVAAQQKEGAAVGIQGTPGFMIYSSTAKAGLEAKLTPIVAELSALGVDASLVEVNGAGTGVVFAGALPYANFQKVMNAFN